MPAKPDDRDRFSRSSDESVWTNVPDADDASAADEATRPGAFAPGSLQDADSVVKAFEVSEASPSQSGDDPSFPTKPSPPPPARNSASAFRALSDPVSDSGSASGSGSQSGLGSKSGSGSGTGAGSSGSGSSGTADLRPRIYADSEAADAGGTAPRAPGTSSSKNFVVRYDLHELVRGIQPGRVILGNYRVVRKIGKGGMGVVWLVEHQILEERRALKLISSGIGNSPEGRARFRREAKVMARLKNAHAVTLHEFDIQDDVGYILMEYVDGKDMRKLLKPDEPMPLPWIGRVLSQLCDVLQSAHDLKVVHRDLKPSNLMMLNGMPEGQEFLKVLDFGVARDMSVPNDRLTLENFVGTVGYASPEQIHQTAGKFDAPIDHRADIYSMGVLLYQFLTGRRPFQGGHGSVLMATLNEPPPSLNREGSTADLLPMELDELVKACLSKSPADRPISAQRVAEIFFEATGLEPPSGPSRNLTPPSWTAIPSVPKSSTRETKERERGPTSSETEFDRQIGSQTFVEALDADALRNAPIYKPDAPPAPSIHITSIAYPAAPSAPPLPPRRVFNGNASVIDEGSSSVFFRSESQPSILAPATAAAPPLNPRPTSPDWEEAASIPSESNADYSASALPITARRRGRGSLWARRLKLALAAASVLTLAAWGGWQVADRFSFGKLGGGSSSGSSSGGSNTSTADGGVDSKKEAGAGAESNSKADSTNSADSGERIPLIGYTTQDKKSYFIKGSPPDVLISESEGVRYLLTPTQVYLPEYYRPAENSPLDASGRWPLRVVRDPDLVEFVYIADGEFLMGAESEIDDNQVGKRAASPVHPVQVGGFYIQRREVDNGEIQRYLASVGKAVEPPRTWLDVLNKMNGQKPKAIAEGAAVGMSRRFAEDFARHHRGQLPTEAQWEFAARSRQRQGRPYVWKAPFMRFPQIHVQTPPQAYPFSAHCEECDDRTDQDVRHMAGNVREWCRDAWRSNYQDIIADPKNRNRIEEPDLRALSQETRFVARGLSLDDRFDDCFNAARCERDGPDQEYYDTGFRIVVKGYAIAP